MNQKIVAGLAQIGGTVCLQLSGIFFFRNLDAGLLLQAWIGCIVLGMVGGFLLDVWRVTTQKVKTLEAITRAVNLGKEIAYKEAMDYMRRREEEESA